MYVHIYVYMCLDSMVGWFGRISQLMVVLGGIANMGADGAIVGSWHPPRSCLRSRRLGGATTRTTMMRIRPDVRRVASKI